MTFEHDFKYDIFISYGHLDDDDPDDDRGWVDLLVERLPGQVAALLGSKPTIWRDQQSLQGNHELEGAIGSGIARSLLFVPIFSPRYVTSEWCRRELELFCAAPPPRVAGVDSFNTRIFKVVKSPLLFKHLSDREPEQLRHLIGYPFYTMADNVPDLYSPDVVSGKDKRYWGQLRRLGLDIAGMLVKLKYGEAGPPPTTTTPSVVVPAAAPAAPTAAPSSPVAPAAEDAVTTAPAPPVPPPVVAASPVVAGGAAPTKFVYLAETAPDLAGERERVRDELKQRGYGVLPEQKLPLEEVEKTEEAVRRDLARCALAVHLVGAEYGDLPKDDGRSVALIQEELAAERERADQSFLRLLWTPAGLLAPDGVKVKDKRQREFIAALQQRVTARAELLQASIEDLKTRIVEKLNPPASSVVAAPPRDALRSRLKYVYLICEQRDRPLVRPIREYLVLKHKFEVITWFDQGAGESLTDYHRKNLKECDAALIFFGNADEPWVRKNLDDLRKAYGYGREGDWAASAVYVGAPPKEEKEDFLTNLAPIIRNAAEFKPEDLREFVSAVEQADNGGSGA